jgi:3'-5' exoribonuclease
MKTYAVDIKENENVDSLFLVREKTSGVTKTGNPYLKLRLGDRSGEIEGRIWSSAETFTEFFQRDDFVRIKGKAVFFQDRLQVNISHIARAEEEGNTLSDFFPTTEKDIAQMCDSLIQISQEVKNPHLRNLLNLFWNDQPFLEGFRKAPASKQIHHAYIGGLIEHTLSLAQLVKSNACHYEGLNTDLLMTGALLHDIGKVYELSYRRSFDYSDEGRLLGHILIGIEKVEEKIRQLIDFPKDLSVLLKHLLLSHHGQYIYGSPKKPMTLEAVMLHHLDDMDAKVSGLQDFLKTKVPSGSKWGAYHPQFEQFFYAPVLEDQSKPSDNIDETVLKIEK